MAKVFVKLPVGMTTEDGHREIECDAATVGEALERVISGDGWDGRRQRMTTMRPPVGAPCNYAGGQT
jgi:hypothetical protein